MVLLTSFSAQSANYILVEIIKYAFWRCIRIIFERTLRGRRVTESNVRFDIWEKYNSPKKISINGIKRLKTSKITYILRFNERVVYLADQDEYFA